MNFTGTYYCRILWYVTDFSFGFLWHRWHDSKLGINVFIWDLSEKSKHWWNGNQPAPKLYGVSREARLAFGVTGLVQQWVMGTYIPLLPQVSNHGLWFLIIGWWWLKSGRCVTLTDQRFCAKELALAFSLKYSNLASLVLIGTRPPCFQGLSFATNGNMIDATLTLRH